MAAELFPFEVHTPTRRLFAGAVEIISLAITDGEIAVHAKHSAFTAPVVPGILKVKNEKGRWMNAFVTEGILEVKDHKTVLMVDAAEWPDEIDVERARAAKEKAEAILREGALTFEMDNAKSGLKRAVMRLKAAELAGK